MPVALTDPVHNQEYDRADYRQGLRAGARRARRIARRHRSRSQWLKVLAGTLLAFGYDLASPDLTGVDVYQVGLHPDRPPGSSLQTRPDTSCPAALRQYRC